MEKEFLDHTLELISEMIAIPSPSGFTQRMEAWMTEKLKALGFAPQSTRKGNILCELGGEGEPLLLMAHLDTLGLMVRSVKPNGHLRFAKIGGLTYSHVMTENVTVFTRDGRSYSGTIQLAHASGHSYDGSLDEIVKGTDTVEVVLDELVSTEQEVRALGIQNGDCIALDPRTRITETGYIKSRYLDDKSGSGVLLALAEAVSRGELRLNRKVTLAFTVHEELLHGSPAAVPPDTLDVISVDMGVVGEDLSGNDRQLSICAGDTRGPSSFTLVNELIEAAQKANCDYVLDYFPYYVSDADVTLTSGHDLRHAAAGPAVFASHGYERTHRSAIGYTYDMLAAYIGVR